jgi:uncharacterized Zn finger protein (UPF0148 family)
MRRFISNGAVGTFASLMTASGKRSRANPVQNHCKRCGVPIDRRGGREYCAPCSSERHDETVAANHTKYQRERRARRVQREAERAAHRD